MEAGRRETPHCDTGFLDRPLLDSMRVMEDYREDQLARRSSGLIAVASVLSKGTTRVNRGLLSTARHGTRR